MGREGRWQSTVSQQHSAENLLTDKNIPVDKNLSADKTDLAIKWCDPIYFGQGQR